MEPQEKARLLISKFYNYVIDDIDYKEYQKRCAIIVVNEILNTGVLKKRECGKIPLDETFIDYWKQVKTFIKKS